MITKTLKDSRLGEVLVRLGTPVVNAALYKQELGEACPSDQAILDEYETLLAEEAASAPLPYQLARQQAYTAAGLTPEAWALAIIQRDVDKQPEEYETLVLLRESVKEEHPKPE